MKLFPLATRTVASQPLILSLHSFHGDKEFKDHSRKLQVSSEVEVLQRNITHPKFCVHTGVWIN